MSPPLIAAAPTRMPLGTGWGLLVAAAASAAHGILFPGTIASGGSLAAQSRAIEAQVMIGVLGVFQLAADSLWRNDRAFHEGRVAARLSAVACLVAALGYGLGRNWSHAPWLTAAGAALNLVLLLALGSRLRLRQGGIGLLMVVAIIALGMLSMASLALAELQPESFRIALLGPYEEYTLRALRLARVAAIVLPVLTLLQRDLPADVRPRSLDSDDALARAGRHAILCGAAGMAPLLLASGLVLEGLKALLVFPSVAALIGSAIAARLAARHAPRLEAWGWLSIACSMAAGLLMGLYALADPWVTISFAADYNGALRRAVRWVHVCAVMLGLVAIFISRQFTASANQKGGRS